MKLRYRSYSFAYLLMAVHKAQGRVRREKRFHPFADCLSMLVFSAMALEAFVNHLGPKVFEEWKPLKQKLSPREKLQLIAEVRGIRIDWGSRPYQAVHEIIRFRNAVAHAESSEVDEDVVSGQAPARAAHWQSYCEREVAERLCADIERVIKELPPLLGIEMPRENLLAEACREGS